MLAGPVARDVTAGASHGYDCGIMARALRTEAWGVQGQYRNTASGIAERRLTYSALATATIRIGRQGHPLRTSHPCDRVAASAGLISAVRSGHRAVRGIMEGNHHAFPRGLVQPVEHGPVNVGPSGVAWFALLYRLRPRDPDHLDGNAVTVRPDADVIASGWRVADQQANSIARLGRSRVEGFGDGTAVRAPRADH